MKSRDEILDAIGREPFSTRRCFYGLLEQFASRPVNGKVVTFKWPDVLGVISLNDWNIAYDAALEMAIDQRRGKTDA
jgi:hypothetical protein